MSKLSSFSEDRKSLKTKKWFWLLISPAVRNFFQLFISRDQEIKKLKMRLSISEQFCNNFELMIPSHRCTVVGNPGGSVLGFFWQILLRGVLGVVRKSGVVVFYCIFMWKFLKIFIGGTWGAPPPPPPPPVCIYVPSPLSIFIDYILMFSNNIPKS